MNSCPMIHVEVAGEIDGALEKEEIEEVIKHATESHIRITGDKIKEAVQNGLEKLSMNVSDTYFY